MKTPKVSLEQWAAFKAVVDAGSFARAAEALNKSQSSISYAIARLEEQLPTTLLETRGRKAVLTDAGEVMYRRAAQLLEQAEEIERAAHYLASGWEAEVVLAVDAILPRLPVFCGLERFAQKHPLTRIRVLETSLSGTDEALLEKQADVALTSRIPPGFLGTPLTRIQMIAVAAPTHPLFAVEHEISEGELGRHRQIVLRDSGTRRALDSGWLGAEQRWTVSHFSTSIQAVKAGLGFAFLPQQMIADELSSGSLRPLRLAMEHRREVALYLVLAQQDSAGPASRAVAAELLRSFAEQSSDFLQR